MLVEFAYVGQDRPPPYYEFVGLVDSKDWRETETLDEAMDRKERFKNQFVSHRPHMPTP